MKKRKIYVLNQRQEETCDAAGKAMRDVFSVLQEKNAQIIRGIPKRCPRWMKVLDLPYLAVFLLLCAGKGDVIFYSIPENHIKIKLIRMFRPVKRYKAVCFINDLNAQRYGAGGNRKKADQEIWDVGAADDVLIPNKNTEKMLRDAGVTANMVPVGIWDYRMDREQVRRLRQTQESALREKRERICIAFAGNLNKSEFLAKINIPEGIQLELWGKLEEQKQKELPEGCYYHGILSSEEIPLAICGMDFGLVWDGSGKDEIEGGLGEYLRYNNSHKCALYLAAGIPVIVWSKSGMAHFVKEHQCGITIDRLSELKKNILAADREQLRQQAGDVASRLWQGFYLKKALDDIL